MALTAYAALTLNGTALSGDTSMSTIGGVDVSSDHIELMEVSWGSKREVSTDIRRTSRRMLPIRLVKRLDQTTPLLYQALTQNQVVAGEIKLFDTNPQDGSTRHRFTLVLANARVLSIESASDSDEPSLPPWDEIELQPQRVTYRDEVNSTEFTDEWSAAV